jgi:hypothetical protein
MKTLMITLTLLCVTLNAEHGDFEEDVQTDSKGNELPVMLPKHVDEDGHAATHADMIDPLHAASLLFPDDVIELIECEFEAEEWQRRQMPRFRMSSER